MCYGYIKPQSEVHQESAKESVTATREADLSVTGPTTPRQASADEAYERFQDKLRRLFGAEKKQREASTR